MKPDLRNVLESTQIDVAARDLMIKELRESALRVLDSPYSKSGIEFIQSMQGLKDLLSKTEHHDSSALDKALLEARIYELCNLTACPEELDIIARIDAVKAKLFELNKE